MATRQATPDELEQLMQHSPELSEAAGFYRAISPVMRPYRQAAGPFHLELQKAQRKLEAGIPLLAGEEIPFDPGSARALFLSLCKKMESYRGNGNTQTKSPSARPRRPLDFLSLWGEAQEGNGHLMRTEATRQIREAVERGRLDLEEVWAMLAAGEARKLELTANGLKLDPALLFELSRLSLKPFFQAWAEGLQAAVGFDRWRQGSCPVCGSSPTLSEIQGKEAARRLRCSLCGASWRYPHLKCAFCGNEDYKQLITLAVEGEQERFKVQACNVCRSYLKVVTTFDPIPVDLLPVQELATLHLDLIAADYDYLRTGAAYSSGGTMP